MRTLLNSCLRGVVPLAGLMALLAPAPAAAQPIGTFRWQQQPYCNVLTVNIVQAGAVYELNGTDDQCGAASAASVVGLAFLNPNGTVGFGLTVVTTPGGTPVHIDASVDPGNVSGAWRDSSGQSGPWTFLPGAALGGSPRPVPRASFPAGLSAGNATITNVGTPAGASDAATKGYVDSAQAATQGKLTAPINMTAYSAATSGSIATDAWGCRNFDTVGSSTLRLDLPLPIGAVLTGLRLKYRDTSPASFQMILVSVDFQDGGLINEGAVARAFNSSNGANGNRLETVTFSPLAPVSATRSYYLWVPVAAHSGIMAFCGVEPIYSLP